MKFKNISAAWSFIYGGAFTSVAPPVQKYETEKAFMNGAGAMFEIMSTLSVATEDTDEGIDQAAMKMEKVFQDLIFRMNAVGLKTGGNQPRLNSKMVVL